MVLYLDERGTPAKDRLFVTGGVLVYQGAQNVAAQWKQFWDQTGLHQKKGRDLDRSELLAVAEFLIGQPVLPVAAWSMLKEEELLALRQFSKKYERSENRLKRFRKISGASWLWYHQMSQTVAFADATFIVYLGPIRNAAVYIDKMSEELEKHEFYQRMLAQQSKSERLEQVAAGLGVTAPLKDLLVSSSAVEWQVEMIAKGPLAHMADVCCAMFGRYINDAWREPWGVVKMRYTVWNSGIASPLGLNLTENVRAWLGQLYDRGDPDRYP